MMASARAEEDKVLRLLDVQCDDADSKLVESIENEANYEGLQTPRCREIYTKKRSDPSGRRLYNQQRW